MEFKIWDKKSKINGVDASQVLNSNKHFINNTVVLFIENGTVVRIEDVEILKSVYKLTGSNTLQIAEEAHKKMNEEVTV